jgi:hypothetical protein
MKPMSKTWSDLVQYSQNSLEGRHVGVAETSLDHLWSDLNPGLVFEKQHADFERMTGADIAVAFLGGFAGALASYWLKEPLEKIHNVSHGAATSDNWLIQKTGELLKHGGSPMDSVRGLKHRLKYGHDILNPFEVWGDLTNAYGGPVKGGLHWIRHLAADTLSCEGLPLPGSSLFRDFLLENLSYDNYKTFGTIKARDLAGAGLTAAILAAYRRCRLYESNSATPNYRYFATNLLAHGTCLISGLMMGSFNYGAVTLIGRNVIRLASYNKQLVRSLDADLNILELEILQPPQYGPVFRDMIAAKGIEFYPV